MMNAAGIAATAALTATIVAILSVGTPTPVAPAAARNDIAPAPVATHPWDWAMVDSLRGMLREHNVAHIDVVAAQAIIETYHFRSDIYRNGNNLFGMRQAAVRPYVTRGERKDHAVYADWRESVLDYALLQAWERKNLTEEQYVESLKGYADAKDYRKKIKSILKTIRERDARKAREDAK